MLDPRQLTEWGTGTSPGGFTIPMAGRFDQNIPRDAKKIRDEEEDRRRRQLRFRELIREWMRTRQS